MTPTTCPDCGQPVLPRADDAQEVPQTQGPLLRRIVYVENKGEKDAAGKAVRRVRVMQTIDFYREGSC